MMEHCNCCGYPLESDDHLFNIHCPASNAEYDQLMAEVAEAQSMVISVETGKRAQEVAREVLAYMRFIRDCTGL